MPLRSTWIADKGGGIDSKDIVVMSATTEYQFGATSAAESTKWLKALEKVKSQIG